MDILLMVGKSPSRHKIKARPTATIKVKGASRSNGEGEFRVPDGLNIRGSFNPNLAILILTFYKRLVTFPFSFFF
jgi:hypothetical protein